MRSPDKTRRRFIQVTSSTTLVGLAGCTGGGDTDGSQPDTEADTEQTEAPSDEEGEEGDQHEEELPDGVSEEEFEQGPVPQVYQSSVSLGGEDRQGDNLTPKADVQFSEFDEARERDAHQPGTCCANCADFIPDKNGDTFGACAEVHGYIDGADWCTVYESLPEPSVPEGMNEDELATAEVPDEYRTASSQGGEERVLEELLTHEEVSLTESVEAIADGMAQPGQSCGNCAEFIPDKNGDGWGACAKVEGYIAIEDWCSLWEHVSAEHEE
ncbi:high-potential iron-sulfur protein [Haloplanus salilacus]|uniref:high-potential iron-sulfur protein n=1 Tax=Haloplanus salilacus TaxID=2949994 RepID=UPI0030CF8E81